VAQRVVNGLEVVDVHEQDRQPALSSPLSAPEGLPQTFDEQPTVGQVGQEIVEGLML
jgi:hypothetical protein